MSKWQGLTLNMFTTIFFNLLCSDLYNYWYVVFKQATWFIKKTMWLKLHINDFFDCHIMCWSKIIPNIFEANASCDTQMIILC